MLDSTTTGAAHSNTAGATRELGRPVVLQVLPHLGPGGAARGCVDVAVALAEAGGTALVASAGGPLLRELERARATHIALPLETKNPWAVLIANVDRLAKAAIEHDVDIIHARSRAPGWSALCCARRIRRPLVTTFHGAYNEASAVKRRYNSVMAKGDRVIAISHYIADRIEARYGVEPDRVRVIYRGVDLDHFDPARVSAPRVIQLSRKWRLPDGVPVVMLPGRLTRWKGQTVFLEALGRLEHRDFCALIVGDDGREDYRREIEALVRARGLESVVRITGHCNDMPAALMLADVVVSASTDPEAFGRVAAEAQAMGRPVIATDHGAARETVIESETGWRVPPGDPAALAETLATALALDSPTRDRMSGLAVAHARRHFSKATMCAQTLAVYEELMAARAADRAA